MGLLGGDGLRGQPIAFDVKTETAQKWSHLSRYGCSSKWLRRPATIRIDDAPGSRSSLESRNRVNQGRIYKDARQSKE